MQLFVKVNAIQQSSVLNKDVRDQDQHAVAIITNTHHMPSRMENMICDRSLERNREG